LAFIAAINPSPSAKLAFLRNAFLQFTGMSNVIFKFAVPLR
jgi:hypothetical protein